MRQLPANEVLRRKVSAEEVQEAILRRDQSINELLKGIRRKKPPAK